VSQQPRGFVIVSNTHNYNVKVEFNIFVALFGIPYILSSLNTKITKWRSNKLNG